MSYMAVELRQMLDQLGHRQVNRLVAGDDTDVTTLIYDTAAPGEHTPESWSAVLARLDRTRTPLARWLEDQK